MNHTDDVDKPEHTEAQPPATVSIPEQDKAGAKKASKKPAAPKKEKPTSVEALIAAALKSRKVPLALEELRRVKDQPHISAEAHPRLLAEAEKQDETLDIARQLMVASLVMAGYPMVADELREFARVVLVHHRCLQGIGETECFPPKDGANPDELGRLLARLREQRDTTVRLAVAAVKQSGVDREGAKSDDAAQALRKARDNAMIAMVLWRYGNKSLPASEAVAALQESVLYTGRMFDREVEAQSLRLLASTQDKTGVSALVQWFSERLMGERRSSDDIRRLLQRDQHDAAELRRENAALTLREAALEEELGTAKSRVAVLKAEIERMNEDAHVKGVHHTDDLSRLRSRVIRLLEDEMLHLSESLTALSREQPKVSVAREYLSIVHDRLAEELKRLKEK